MNRFTEELWQQVLSNLALVLGTDAKKYEKNPAAKLFAAIPYLADSEDPDRFALSNLLTFHAATKAREVFNHRPSDDVDPYRRLACFHVGNQADPKVVDYGLTLLALISLSDHEHDRDGDKKVGKYNPLNEGKWDATKVRTDLQAELDKNPALKASFGEVVDFGVAAQGWWNS